MRGDTPGHPPAEQVPRPIELLGLLEGQIKLEDEDRKKFGLDRADEPGQELSAGERRLRVLRLPGRGGTRAIRVDERRDPGARSSVACGTACGGI